MTMEFNDKQTIYLQIVDYMEEHILEGAWKGDEKIPSVRDLAVELQVNPNTVMRAYEQLQQRGIVQNRRGVGHFIAPGAADLIRKKRRETFIGQELPRLFRQMSLMNIRPEEVMTGYHQFTDAKNKTKNIETDEKK
jgi:DNA-binding transcriptional regulator YhcF (GntR family)